MEAKARANAADFTVPDGECFLDSIPQREYPRGMFTLLFQNEKGTLLRAFFAAFAVCFCLCSCDETQKNRENVRRRAEQGEAAFQTLLGWTYLDGVGVPKDVNEAVKWFRKAAEQGDVVAQSRLGSIFEFGKGVPKNDAEAVEWYRMAAEQGDKQAQSSLAHMYFLHRGVARDDATNYKWALLAAAQAEDMKVIIASLEEIMTPEQRTEGQRMAREFKATKQTR